MRRHPRSELIEIAAPRDFSIAIAYRIGRILCATEGNCSELQA
jgi:hypothetical protein